MLGGQSPRALAVGSSLDSTSSLLISHPVDVNGDAHEWTRAVDGVVRAAAAGPDGTVGVVRVRPTGVMVFESTLEVLRVDDGRVVSLTALPAGEEVSALTPYDTGDSRLWLLETYTEDHTTRLATVSGGGIRLLREIEEDGIASARIVDLDGNGQNEIVCVQRVDEPQMTAISYPSCVCVVRLEGEDGYTAIHSEAYLDVGIESIDCGDLNGDDRQEVIVGYQVGTSHPEPHVDVLALR